MRTKFNVYFSKIFYFIQANEYDISFLPITNRRHEGKALYSYGKLTIFIERGVVFYQAPNGSFNPISITNLVNLAK